MWEKKSKKRKSDDEPKIKVERSRDGREWIPDDEWFAMKNHIDFFDDDDERPSRKKRNAERGFGAKKTVQKAQHQVLQGRRSLHREVHRKNRAEVAVAQPATTMMISTHHVAVAEAEGDKMLI